MCVIDTSRVRGPSSCSNCLENQRAAIVHRRHAQPRARQLADQLPRHDVRVVLHCRDEDLVTLAERRPREALRDQIDALGGVAREDDFVRLPRVEEPADALARRLERVGCPGAQLVHAAMDVCVDRSVVARDRLDHRARLLGRRRVVQIDERLVVNCSRKNREVGANALDVVRRRRGPGARLIARRGDRSARHARDGRHAPSTSARSRASCAKSSASSASRSGSICTRSRICPANAWISMSRASANVRPLARR